jgi:hypothetical protein
MRNFYMSHEARLDQRGPEVRAGPAFGPTTELLLARVLLRQLALDLLIEQAKPETSHKVFRKK